MNLDLSILYRGPLSSCNYGCAYCPFAKHSETAAEHETDRAALDRFVTWIAARPASDRIAVFFTPWGEALVRRRYQRAIIRLSRLPQARRVAIQTNLSCRVDWVEECDKDKIAFWATYHPTQAPRARFVERCLDLSRRGMRYSVGVVGLREHADEIEALRRELPDDVYLWINAYKRDPAYYDQAAIDRFVRVDPLFPINTMRHLSKGRPCRAGASVVSVDGDGMMRRCHFIKDPIGNLYDPLFADALRERACTNETCGCHIGYVHLGDLGLYDVFGAGVLERIPARPLWQREGT